MVYFLLLQPNVMSGLSSFHVIFLLIFYWGFFQIREDVKSGVYVENLTEEYVSTMKDVTQLLIKVCINNTLL